MKIEGLELGEGVVGLGGDVGFRRLFLRARGARETQERRRDKGHAEPPARRRHL